MGWLQFDWNYRSPLAVRCCWWNARTSRLQSMEHHGKLKSLIIKNHGKLKTLMIETHESKTNISPSCLFQTVFLHVGVDHNLSLKNNKCFCHRNLSYIWITFIIQNTSLGYVTTLREYPSHPFEGNRFPTDFTADSNGRILPPRVKLMVDWTTHLNQNMHTWTGFISKSQVLATKTSGPWQVLFYQSWILLIKMWCVSFPEIHRFMSLIQASTCIHLIYKSILHHLPKIIPSWRDKSLPTNLWQPDQ